MRSLIGWVSRVLPYGRVLPYVSIGRLTVCVVPRWCHCRLREDGIHSWDIGCVCLEWDYSESRCVI